MDNGLVRDRSIECEDGEEKKVEVVVCWEQFQCLKKKVNVPATKGRARFAVDMDNKGGEGSMVVTAISRDNSVRTVLAGAILPSGDGPVVRIGHHVLPPSNENRANRRGGEDVPLDQVRTWVALAGSGSLLLGLGMGYWWGSRSRSSSGAFPPKRESTSGSAAAYVLREETPMTELQSPAAAASMATHPTRVRHVYYSHHHAVAPDFEDSHAFRPVYPSSDRGQSGGGGVATRRPRRYRGYPSRYMPMDESDGEEEDVQPLALFTGR